MKPSGVPNVQYLDANVFIFAGQDIGKKGERARAILKSVSEGRIEAATCCLAADEIIWAMRRFVPYNDAIRHGEAIFLLKNLRILSVTPSDILRAIKLMRTGIKPRDSIHAAVAINNGIKEIVSDDPDFEDIKELKWRPLV